MDRVAVVVVPRTDPERVVLEYAWAAVRALSGSVRVEPVVPVPRSIARSSRLRERMGRSGWPQDLEDRLLALEPRPRLVRYTPILGRSLHSAAASLARDLGPRPPSVLLGSLLDEAGFVAAAAAQRLERPGVAVAHGSDVVRWRRRPRSPSALRTSQALRRCSGVLAVSSAVADPLRSVGLQVPVVPFTVFPDEFPLAKELPGGPTRLLNVGRVGPLKGFDVAIKVLDALPHATLTAVGGLEFRQFPPFHPRMRWLGSRPQSELPALYADHHVLLHPSRAEGLGNVLVESMLVGRPAVARRVGGIPEVVGPRVGALVDGDDPGAWAQAIEAVRGRQLRGDLDPGWLRRSALPWSWAAAGPALLTEMEAAIRRHRRDL